MINYQKRKNATLFHNLENQNTLFLSKIQNYIPIYNRFFSLNEINYNSINLNNNWFLLNVDEKKQENNTPFYNCTIKNMNTEKTKKKELFFKEAPLLDPFKYLIGKYDVGNKDLFNLPQFNSTIKDIHPKILDVNNSAYVDGMFLYLTNQLSNKYYFTHNVEYYGSFLAIKNDYQLNVYDDIEYLSTSDFFNKNKDTLFKIENYDHLFIEENKKKPIINILHNTSIKSIQSIKSIHDEFFENIFDLNTNTNCIDLESLKDFSIELEDITNNSFMHSGIATENSTTLKSETSCSSRTSYTSGTSVIDQDNLSKKSSLDNSSNSDKSEWEDEESSIDEDEKIMVTIPKFPIQLICMENCSMTLDELMIKNEINQGEWFSMLMQVIMILITYQKTFSFTHNDLHTNNIMFNYTNNKYIYYCYENIYYQVPTFGRIYKIIDFGRSIFKYDGKTFCSDSFQQDGDASTQYNTEPYFNSKKPRLEPNFSFDLCRLACSIFDYVVDDIDEVNTCTDALTKLIIEWCLDDKGINLLYKNNGSERYPEFKLYKMIARCVHKHTPHAQLERNEFKSYRIMKNALPLQEKIINIDEMPILI
jgi:hypothetical protein